VRTVSGKLRAYWNELDHNRKLSERCELYPESYSRIQTSRTVPVNCRKVRAVSEKVQPYLDESDRNRKLSESATISEKVRQYSDESDRNRKLSESADHI
jgi:hypothetical protein